MKDINKRLIDAMFEIAYLENNSEALDFLLAQYPEYREDDTLLESIEDAKTCVICNQEYTGYGNNAEPVAKGQCCDKCNMEKVIPARLGQSKNLKEYCDDDDDFTNKPEEDDLEESLLQDGSGEVETFTITLRKDGKYVAESDVTFSELVADTLDELIEKVEDDINYTLDTDMKVDSIKKNINVKNKSKLGTIVATYKYNDPDNWNVAESLDTARVEQYLQEGMKGQYVVMGVTDNGERKYYNADLRDWFDTAEQGTIFTDHDLALDSWSVVTKNGYELPYGFRRVFVPNYNPDAMNKESTVNLKESIKKSPQLRSLKENSRLGKTMSIDDVAELCGGYEQIQDIVKLTRENYLGIDCDELAEMTYHLCSDNVSEEEWASLIEYVCSSLVNESMKLKENIENKWNIGSNKLVQVGSPEYLNLQELAQKLEDNSPNGYRYEVEKTYEDFGAGMQWYTIICYDNRGDHWQVLNTKDWLDLANGRPLEDVYDTVISNKYFQDKNKDYSEMNTGELFDILD